MELLAETPHQRTRVMFFLILAAALLWAVFLIHRGEMLQFTFMFASLAAINPVVAFIEMKNPAKSRSLFFFYLLVLVMLLWAAFLSYLGVHLWVSLFLFILAVGVPFILNYLEAEERAGNP
ncbi:MAG: hypothetical protein GYA23_09805 [Methanomicrobiales archaeon]|nr:hypothetical protein [Methanomicrobiales archaeon]